ncbi:hypothetical protein [Paraburkholderia sp. MM6662-R1]|uniref:hypothetical protein n=1 Tax=Paraburkholderia sp. MM6662-R1 TaxID=2991066 RepID=UPI003D24A632
MRKRRIRPALPPHEVSAQLRARLRRFALATRDDATRLAGPLRRIRPYASASARSGPQQGRGAAGVEQEDDSNRP